MSEATAHLKLILESLTQLARRDQLTDREWAERAGVRKETLSRLRRRANCDFATLAALAHVVGARVGVNPVTSARSADGLFPAHLDRVHEARLVDLCASGELDFDRWAALGPRFFMAGLAVMLASVQGFDRQRLLALAEQMHPGVSEPHVFALWLERNPVRPSRFLPLVAQRVRHAA